MRLSVVIAAGGASTRFRKALPYSAKRPPNKLLAELGAEPLLLRSLKTFASLKAVCEIVCALSPELLGIVKGWRKTHGLSKLRFVRGGKTRAESVYRALKATRPAGDWVLIHDGARPLVQTAAIETLLRRLKSGRAGGFILARAVVPTIKRALPVSGRILATLDRSELFEAETPQAFKRSILLSAFKKAPAQERFFGTDEAALLEKAGYPVHVVKHDTWNPKITTVNDLELAEAYLQSQSSRACPWRVGLGADTHRLGAGRKFYLGGLRLKAPYGPLGHSDGDALLHAITDAAAGALGLGDIGEFFSDKNPKFKNIRSAAMLEYVLKRAAEKGWKPVQVDTIIHLERPRLGPVKDKIKMNLAKLLRVAPDCVGVKAKTFEGLVPAAEARVECQALLMMGRRT